MSPAVATLEPSGIKSEQIYLLTNNSPGPAAIQFSVKTRQQRNDGSEVQNPADQLFSVNPKQAVIPSGGTQKIRVRWLGGSNVHHEQAYRFIARQLPIQLAPEGKISLSVTMNIEGALYIKPVGQTGSTSPAPAQNTAQKTQLVPGESSVAQPDQTSTRPEMLQVKKVLVVNTPQGKQLALTVTNPAREHIILDNIRVQLSSAGRTPITLSDGQTGNMLKQNLLAGSTRNFIMPVPAGFDPQQQWQGRISR
ncbi:MAG: hypothetical protein R3F02_21995 [Thiolinea sp.]